MRASDAIANPRRDLRALGPILYALIVDKRQRIKMIASLALILLVSFVGLSYYSYEGARGALLSEIRTSGLPLTRENIYSDIMAAVLPPLNISSLMANDAFLVSWIEGGERDLEALQGYLGRIRERYGYFASFFVSEATGNYYIPQGILKRISKEDAHDVWYYRFAASGARYKLDVDTNQAAGDALTIFINFRVESAGGRFLGVAGVGIEMDNFKRTLLEAQEKYGRHIFMTDPDGVVQAHSETEAIQKASIREMPGLSAIADSLLAKGEEPIDASYEGPAGKSLATSRFMPELDWFLIVEQRELEATAGIRQGLYLALAGGLVASLVILALSIAAIGFYQRKLELAAVTDPLTGAGNRRDFERAFAKAEYRAKRYGAPLSLAIIDVDRFKAINDKVGHQRADEALKRITAALKGGIRATDHLARWGGDEFALILECGLAEAAAKLEALASEIRGIDMPVALSVSAGVASLAEGEGLEALLSRADKALYEAKEAGRDRVVAK
jgi:diguanylate cyclase (GGDEF)-like protein